MAPRPLNPVLGLVFLTTVLAGCTDSGAAGAITGPGADVQIDDTVGAIQGLVLTDELVPIPNATVGIVDPPKQTTSDPNGAFSLGGLEPGRYALQAVALGYESASISVEVLAGQATQVQFALAALPSDGPYHETTYKKDYVRSIVWRIGPNCDTIVQPPLGTCLGFQAHDVTYYKILAADWVTVIDEARWTPNSALFHKQGYVFADFPGVQDFSGVPDFKSPGHFEANGVSPVSLRIERQVLVDKGWPDQNQAGNGTTGRGTRFRHVNNFNDTGVEGVVGVSLMLDQYMDTYNTVFHKELAPPRWTALPDQ